MILTRPGYRHVLLPEVFAAPPSSPLFESLRGTNMGTQRPGHGGGVTDRLWPVEDNYCPGRAGQATPIQEVATKNCPIHLILMMPTTGASAQTRSAPSRGSRRPSGHKPGQSFQSEVLLSGAECGNSRVPNVNLIEAAVRQACRRCWGAGLEGRHLDRADWGPTP